MISSYTEALSFLQSFIDKGKRHDREDYPKKLARMRRLLELVGNPDKLYPVIHIGGTCGKGSTAVIAGSVLQSARFSVGVHTQPYLTYFGEKIVINDQAISDRELVDLIEDIKPAIEILRNSELGLGPNFYFPLSTALAFLAFAKRKVDVAVIEVAMGGEYDPTNVVTPSSIIITNVSLDHTEYLGNTVSEIAQTKSGIIKPKSVVVTAADQPEVIEIIKKRASQNEAPIFIWQQDFGVKNVRVGQMGTVFDYWSRDGNSIADLRLSLIGTHQAINASCAITALAHTNKLQISELAVREGASRAFIPGRFEIVQKDPVVILDGAHNPAKMQATVETFKQVFPGEKAIIVVGMVQGRSVTDTLLPILTLGSRIIATTPIVKGKDPVPPSEIAACARNLGQENIAIVEDPHRAFEIVLKEANRKDIILVTGSFYLIGPLRARWFHK